MALIATKQLLMNYWRSLDKMFHIKTTIKNSPLHGIGLFADENIFKGQKIYTENPNLDIFLSNEEFSKLPENEKTTIQHYGYFDIQKNKWHLNFDDMRFCNHSKDGNITLIDKIVIIAKKDIKKGEELTQNYEEFEVLRDKLKNC